MFFPTYGCGETNCWEILRDAISYVPGPDMFFPILGVVLIVTQAPANGAKS